ncbi:hypothetical protein H2200_007918 [Cladophialophora chaetospira]|uniref:Nuclear envelope protein n=1 Tax=Cladophialophora chaetospira TaxID=386627 RepID=A0AA38X6R1_9EURO|nr:hypothetical protein H2200_007918 [Cladophialophora chaetospira]
MSTVVATPATTPPRPYRRFLNSRLHKRFVHAAIWSLLLGLVNAFCLGSKKDLFWSWFPLGPAGLKALLFFMSSLFIFILQIATLKVGRQTTTSPWATFRSNFLSGTAIQTVLWYVVSAWWFTEAYIWSSPSLGWITRGTHNTPDVLNERPIFFRLYSLVLAVGYAGVHLYRGNSSLRIPVSKLPATPTAEARAQDTHPLEPILKQLQRRAIPALIQSASVSGAAIVLAPFINGIFLRNILWQIHLALAKPFFNLSRANARPIGYPPLGLTYLLHCLFAGFLLVMTWEVTSALFLINLNQEPTKSGLPLSAASKDPNGTLLTGLKAKRDVVRTFAFWELAVIVQKHKERRKAIFEDIERPTGPMWTQMVQAGLNVLQEIQVRISGPSPAAMKPTSPQPATSLPRLLPEVQTESIFAKDAEPTTRGEWLATPLKAFGSTKQPWRPPIEQTAKQVETKLLEYTRPPGADKAPSTGFVDQWITALKQSPVGWIFTSTNAAKINATVLGSPYGNAAVVVDVIEALTKMQVASLSEDTYGKATPTVPDTVRTFTTTLSLIEGYVSQSKQGVTGGIEEVEIIIERLRASLKELLSAFQVYLIDQGLGIGELNQAKKAIQTASSKPPQIQEKPKNPPKPIEQRTERRLFQLEKPKETRAVKDAAGRKGSYERVPPRVEEAVTSSWTLPRNNAAGPLFQRREMEQVR